MALLLAEGGLLDALGINPLVVAIQAVIFITTFLVLSQLLFKRVLVFMQTREKEQADAVERVKKDREELARVTREYEERIAKVEKDAYAKLQEVLKEAVEAKNKIVSEASAKARSEADAAKARVAVPIPRPHFLLLLPAGDPSRRVRLGRVIFPQRLTTHRAIPSAAGS